ncbi:MAG: hypothetical protein WAL63_10165 [Solirubrobacteraceae bacterium]
MISTSATKLEPVRPEDGSLGDLDPRRRARRLAAAGVRIERGRALEHLVHLPDGRIERRRTFRSAERTAHTFLDRQDHQG